MQAYDEVPYPGGAIHDSHPDRLATMAVLHGLEPPDIRTARVLELGCGDASNLLPMAHALPDAHFVGIDTAAARIAAGRQRAAVLGAKNLELRVADIREVADTEDRPYDYVICHGVYSWVPPEVQRAILQICARSLTAHGVAYVSYNAMPGWGTRGAVRDLMRMHAGADGRPADRVSEAKRAVTAIASLGSEGPWGELLRRESAVLADKGVGYLFHDHLADVNEALYLTDFARRATACGLAYLTDASVEFCTVPARAREVLSELTHDPLRTRQYWDFATNRGFQCSVLVRDGTRPTPDLLPARVERLWVSGRVRPEAGEWPDEASSEVVAYTTPKDRRFQLGHPAVKAALKRLTTEWPAAVRVTDISATTPGRTVMLTSLLEGFRSGFLHLSTAPGRYAIAVSEVPVASPLARLQVAMDDPWVTSLRHTEVNLGPLTRRVLLHLDGRSLAEVRAAVVQDLRDGLLALKPTTGEGLITDPDMVEHAVRQAVADKVQVLLRAGLLVE